MLKWVYEFNQEKLLALQTDEYKINPSDVLILHSIVNSVCSVKMQTILDDNRVYVWIDHTNLIEQLPILGITSKQRLSTVLKKLKDLGLIVTKNFANHNCRGSKQFIALSDNLIDCLSDNAKRAHDSKKDQLMKTRSENRPVNENEKSSNTQYSKNNKELSKDNSNNISKSFFGSAGKKKSKKFTYQDCIASINDFTDDKDLRTALVDYFNLRLSMMKEKPMRLVQWKSMLVTLKKAKSQSSSNVTYEDIVRRAIERGYTSFYPINNYSYSSKPTDIRKGKAWEEGLSCETYTEEEKREIDRMTAEREARGEQVWY